MFFHECALCTFEEYYQHLNCQDDIDDSVVYQSFWGGAYRDLSLEEGFRGGSGSGTLNDREKRETDESDKYDKMLIYLDKPTKHHQSIVPFIACANLSYHGSRIA